MHFDVEDMLNLRYRQNFISLSSRDVEFKSLLETADSPTAYPFGNLEISANKERITYCL